ncbi:MAG: type II toxin-antitoxin system prevent-host-death family antitoxin [Deinococcota bacterium]|nr:type II toxin-antitoxin system prevent-host-death family antitoxin [Deinococcota bacterium]
MVRRALAEGPQFVTRHGDEVVVVLSAKAYRPRAPDCHPSESP